MDNKIIFFDVDGTIVRHNDTIPESAERAIRAAAAAGHICVVNTGRPFSHIVDCVTALPFAGYVCGCGQQIIYNGEFLKDARLGPEECAEIIAMWRRCRVETYIEGDHGAWVDFHSHPREPFADTELGRFKARGFDVDSDITTPGFVFDKFCIWSYPDSDRETFLAEVSKYYSPIDCGIYTEMVRNGCSKQSGILELIDHLGIKWENTYAIGDSHNDVPMLSCVAHSAVMGGSPAHVCASAEFVSTTLEEDGLANALAHFGLI